MDNDDALLNFFIAQKNVFIYFAMFLSVPSALLYSAEIVTILRHKCFHTSFHALFIMRSIPDLLYTLDSYYGYRLPNLFGRFLLNFYRQLPNWPLALFSFLTNYTYVADNLATAFILFHRFTAIALPMKHEKIWQKLLPLTFLVIFCVPMYTVELFKIQGIIVVMNGTAADGSDLYFGISESSSFIPHYIRINAISSILFLLVCAVINVATFVAYRKKQDPILRQQNADEADTLQMKLLVYAVLTFFGHMLIALLMISIAIFVDSQSITALTVLNSQYPWIVDLGTVVLPSWLLLWASPKFRNRLLADFMPKWILRRFCYNGNSIGVVTCAAGNVKPNSWTAGAK